MKVMTMTQLATDKMLHDMTEAAIREAILLQKAANKERFTQVENEAEGRPYNYAAKDAYEQGVHALCEVLWRFFGGCTMDSINAIRKVVAKSEKDKLLGLDSRDYIKLFMDAFKE